MGNLKKLKSGRVNLLLLQLIAAQKLPLNRFFSIKHSLKYCLFTKLATLQNGGRQGVCSSVSKTWIHFFVRVVLLFFFILWWYFVCWLTCISHGICD